MILWRISNYATLDGIGGTIQSARWHTRGKPIVYTADHPASALLEMLVNTDTSLLPDTFQLIKISVPETIKAVRAKSKPHWLNEVSISRSIGNDWLARQVSLLLQVPSAILPDVFNTLVNPQHPDAHLLKIMSVEALPLDTRLK